MCIRDRASIAFDRALSDAKKLGEERHGELLVGAANVGRKLGRVSRVRELLVQAAAMTCFDNKSYLYAMLGAIELKTGNATEAVTQLKRAIKINREWQWRKIFFEENTYLQLAGAYMELKRHVEARRSYGEAARRFSGLEKAVRGWHRANNALPKSQRTEPPFKKKKVVIPVNEYFSGARRLTLT